MHAATLVSWYPLAAVPPLAIHLHKHLASCYPLPSYPSFRPFRPPIILTLFLPVSSIKQPSSNILLTSLLLQKSTCLTTHLASSPSLRGISSCGRYCIRMSLLSWLVPSNSGGSTLLIASCLLDHPIGTVHMRTFPVPTGECFAHHLSPRTSTAADIT